MLATHRRWRTSTCTSNIPTFSTQRFDNRHITCYSMNFARHVADIGHYFTLCSHKDKQQKTTKTKQARSPYTYCVQNWGRCVHRSPPRSNGLYVFLLIALCEKQLQLWPVVVFLFNRWFRITNMSYYLGISHHWLLDAAVHHVTCILYYSWDIATCF